MFVSNPEFIGSRFMFLQGVELIEFEYFPCVSFTNVCMILIFDNDLSLRRKYIRTTTLNLQWYDTGDLVGLFARNFIVIIQKKSPNDQKGSLNFHIH